MPAYPAIAAVPGATCPAVVLPLDLIGEAVAAAGCRERRRRLLPAAAVMVFVLGLCLFSGEGYGEVARKLASWLAPLAGPRWRVPGTSALARARRRVGPRPFELLFWRLAGPLAGPRTPGAGAFGREVLLMSVDGTTLDVPYTAANVAAFGPPPSGRSQGGFPQVRLLALIGCGTRGLAGAASGPRTAGEQHLAREIAARGILGEGMLVLADRNFCGHPVVSALARGGADVIIRARSSQVLPVLRMLPDRSYLSVLPDPAASRARHRRNGERRRTGSKLAPDRATLEGIPVRVIEADITARRGGAQPVTTRYRLITTLLDPAEAPAVQAAALYAQRWESETGFRELKVFLRGAGRVLRSRDPAGVTQEIWALLCAHQLIQATRAAAAAAPRTALDPDRVSYTVTLRALRRQITAGPARPARTRHAAITEILSQLLPATRRQRSHPRVPGKSTAARRKARAATPGPINYKITISAPQIPDP